MKAFFSKSYNIFALVMLVIMAVSVLIPPICAVPDAGEYFNTFTRTGFYNTSEHSISLSYGLAQPQGENFTFFERFLMGVASVNKLLYSKEVFDIRFLSVIYMLLFLAAAYFFMKNMYTKSNIINYALGAVMVIFFCDLGYIAYFNSFYASALNLVLIFAMLSIAVAMGKKFKMWKLCLYTLVAIAYVLTMYQNFVAGAVAAVLLALFSVKRAGVERIAGVVCAVIILAVSVASAYTANIPNKQAGVFNSIFYGVLMDSPNADGAANILGVEAPELIGKTSYEANAEDMALVKDIGYLDIMKCYISYPSILLNKMDMAVKNSYFLVQDFLDYNDTKLVPFKIWDLLKRKVIPQSLWIVLIYAVAFLVISIKEFKQKGGVYIFAAVLPIALITELVFSFVLNGGVLISMKLFSYGIYLDIMLMLTIVWAIDVIMSRRKEIKEKYGVNQ